MTPSANATGTAKRTVPPSRILEIDAARCLAILSLPMIHCYEEFALHSEAPPGGDVLRTIVMLLCGFAPYLFMVIMGINTTLSKRNSPSDLARRGLRLILCFFALNVARFLLPSATESILGEWCLPDGVYFCLTSDILFLAGASLLVIALSKRLSLRPVYLFAFSLALFAASAAIPDVSVENEYLGAFLGNFIRVDSDSCFPLLSWLVYPCAGLLAGDTVKATSADPAKKKRFWMGTLCISAFLLACLWAILKGSGHNSLSIIGTTMTEYENRPLNAICCMSWTCLVASVCALWCIGVKSDRIRYAIYSLSDATLVFYCMQWIIVGWLEYLAWDFCNGHFILTTVLVYLVSTILSPIINNLLKAKGISI